MNTRQLVLAAAILFPASCFVSIFPNMVTNSVAQEVNERPTWYPPAWSPLGGGNEAFKALPPEKQEQVKQLWYLENPSLQRPDETPEDVQRRLEQIRLDANLEENVAAIELVLSKLSEEQLTSSMGELLPDQLEAARQRVAEYVDKIQQIDTDPLNAAREFARSHGRELDPTDYEIRRGAAFARKRLETELEKELNEVLLFHQMRVVDAWRPERRGIASTLVDTPIGDALGLSKRQKEQLRERSDEIGIEFMRAYKKALRESEELYANILNDEQAKQLKEIYYSSSWIERPFVPSTPQEILHQISRESLAREAKQPEVSVK